MSYYVIKSPLIGASGIDHMTNYVTCEEMDIIEHCFNINR